MLVLARTKRMEMCLLINLFVFLLHLIINKKKKNCSEESEEEREPEVSG